MAFACKSKRLASNRVAEALAKEAPRKELEGIPGVSHGTAGRNACILEHGLSAETTARLSERFNIRRQKPGGEPGGKQRRPGST